MSDTARHDNVTSPAVTDSSLPVDGDITAPMALPRRASKASGKSDGAFERALSALEDALEAAIVDASVTFKPRPVTPIARLTPLAQPVMVKPVTPKAIEKLVDELVKVDTSPAQSPVTPPAAAPKTIEPVFLPQEDVGDGDPIFVQPEFERIPAPQSTIATRAAAPQHYSVPPLLLAADASLRIRAAARAVLGAMPQTLPAQPQPIAAKPAAPVVDVAMPSIPVPEKVADAAPQVETPKVETPQAEAAKPATAPAQPEADPFTLYPFGEATYRLLVM